MSISILLSPSVGATNVWPPHAAKRLGTPRLDFLGRRQHGMYTGRATRKPIQANASSMARISAAGRTNRPSLMRSGTKRHHVGNDDMRK